MSKESLSHFGEGGINVSGSGPGSLKAILTELHGLTQVVVAGTTADTNIAVAGIATEDTILSAVMFDTGVPSVVPATITSAGNIQSTEDTSGNTILLTYYNKK